MPIPPAAPSSPSAPSHRLVPGPRPSRRWPAHVAVAVLATLLAACGKGGESADGSPGTMLATGEATVERKAVPPASAWVTPTPPADPLLQNLTIPADAATKGMWSAQAPWPMNGLHAVLLPDGRVMTYGTTPDGGGQNGRYIDIWSPSLGLGVNSHTTVYRADLPDSFCGASTFLADGKLLMNGGNSDVVNNALTGTAGIVWSSTDGGLVRHAYALASPRWYSTMLTLADGRAMILGGMKPYSEGMQDNPDVAVTQGLASMTPEVLETNGWRALQGATSRDAFGPDYLRTSYPRAWVAPNGKVFGISAETTWWLDPSANGGNGSVVAARFKTANDNVNLPNTGATSTAVMFDVGKVLQVGGNGAFNGDGRPASRKATVLDFAGGTLTLAEQPPMNFPRRYGNAVALADGRVLVTGGTRAGNNNGADAVYEAELWNPATGAWTVGARAAVFRGYHSFSVLLPNGTVLSTGGGTPGPVTNLNAEIYYPPNLFRAVNGGSQLAPRPVVKGVSGLSYAHGDTLQLDLADAATAGRLVLLGHSAGTHSFNSGQRRIPLAFTMSGARMTAQIPSATITPPGYYQLVVVDPAGVPSVGIPLAIGQGVRPPSTPTTPYTPPTIGGTIDATPVTAGGTVTYAPTGLAGLTYSWNFGDGNAATPFTADPRVSYTYANAGVYGVTLTARAADGSTSQRSFVQAVTNPVTATAPVSSSPLVLESRSGAAARLWVVNPDSDTVAVFDAGTRARLAEIPVGVSPRSVARAPSGRLWVANKQSATLSLIDPASLAVAQTIALPRASQPHGLAFAPDGSAAYVVLEATGQLLKLDPATGALRGTLALGATPRHLAIASDGRTVLVSRYITPALPGESTATVDTSTRGGELLVVDGATMALTRTVTLRHSDRTDTEIQGRGIPNYLAAPAIAPDGATAWVPSKQDNVKRGTLRDGRPLDFQNTVRAVSSRIDLRAWTEDPVRRVDHDNSSLGSAAAFDPRGAYLFVALETSRQVAVVDAAGGRELFRIEAGRAPQGVAVSADGRTLYVQNFMDRSVGVFDLTPLMTQGALRADPVATLTSTTAEKLAANVLQGKRLFYDARDPRLARDGYMSCASCHNDAGHDGRTWDFTGFGEGLRNTPSLKGRGGVGQGFVHWSANFDEIQDFEGQIRAFAGGTGLMTDAQFNTGTRSTPLGDRKAGVSADLDALAAYLASRNTFEPSPLRNADGTLTGAATLGKAVFTSAGCASCHTGTAFTLSGDGATLKNVGTIKASSGKRLGGTLAGLDVPTLRDVWSTAPYLHDGSAPTLAAAVTAHAGSRVAGADLDNLVAYLGQIGSQETGAPSSAATGSGTGLTGNYFANTTLTGSPSLTRTEVPWFDWGTGAPGPGVPADNFSVRWTGEIQAIEAGAYQFRTNSDDGVRVWINGAQVISNWTVHPPTIDTSPTVTLAAGQRVPIVIEFQEFGGGAVLQLSWLRPGGAWAAVPATQLYPAAGSGTPTTLPPSTATGCGTEGATCALPAGATATVWYGANGSWAVKTGVTGSIACTNAVFGDPLVGTVKSCVYVVTSSTAASGTGLTGQYFANATLSGSPVLTRGEAPWFDWGTGAPGAGVPADNFSVRWSGQVQAIEAGSYQFRTRSDDGVRVWVNGTLVINNWTAHAPTTDTSGVVTLAAGQRVSIVIEYQEFGGGAVLQLSWLRPGGVWSAVPAAQLYR